MRELNVSNAKIREALEIVSKLGVDNQVKLEWDAEQRARIDYNSGITYARRQGMEQGQEKEKMEIALNMYKAGLSLDMISRITSLSINQIQEIIETNKCQS